MAGGYYGSRGVGYGVKYDKDGNRVNRGSVYNTQADDSGPLAWNADVENPDPYAYTVDRGNFQYGGVPGMAQHVADNNRALGRATLGTQAYQMDGAQQNQARGYQGVAAGSYMDTLRGRNPSLAQMQLQQGLAQSNAAASGMAAGARGGGANLAAAQRNAMRQQGLNQSNFNQQAGMLRAHEIAQAQAGLAGVGGQMRGQDIGWQGMQAQNELGQRTLNQNAAQGWERLAQSPEQAQLQASAAYEREQRDAEEEARKRRYDMEKTNTGYEREDTKGVLDTIGKMFGMSDIKSKENISDVGVSDLYGQNPYARKDSGLEEFNPYDGNAKAAGEKSGGMFDISSMMGGGGGGGMSGMFSFSDERTKEGTGVMSKRALSDFAEKLDPKSYNYKFDAPGEPRRVGVMAQDMEKSAAGKSAVFEEPKTGLKAIDINRGLSLALASVASLHDEVAKLKGGKRG
jgi:hypothetical protein